ncbi:hypothetical protein [Marisediminicola sp. LYQ134]|uniref:hypothetical protein n=1 Tax=Marisediminicola sp. LYQ134 TaxID=3391061 RepID=UPI003983A5BF
MTDISVGSLLAGRLRDRLANVTYTTEDDLQAAVNTAVVASYRVAREVRLSDGKSRIDLMVTGILLPNVGIEVKIDGSLSSVIRQLDRYAACDEIGELILVTTRAKHHHVPRIIGARRIPVHLVSLVENGL